MLRKGNSFQLKTKSRVKGHELYDFFFFFKSRELYEKKKNTNPQLT